MIASDRRVGAWLPILGLLALQTAFFAFYKGEVVDDAYITFRYVNNLLSMHELAWNAGERVEGLTNLLWALILAGSAFSFPSIELPDLALYLGAATYALNGVVIFLMGRTLGHGVLFSVLGALAFQLNSNILGLSTNGLETSLFALLAGTFFYFVLKRQYGMASVAVGLLFATRPEGAVFGVLGWLCVCLFERSLSKNLKPWWPALAIAGCVEAFRLLYFGALVPNSIAAKSIGLSLLPEAFRAGLLYLIEFGSSPFVLVVMLFPVLLALRQFRNFRSGVPIDGRALFPLAVLLMSFGIVLRNGGDWMPDYRLVLQYYPVLAAAMFMVLPAAGRYKIVAPALAAYSAVMIASKLELPARKAGVLSTKTGAYSSFYGYATRQLKKVVRRNDLVSAEAAGYLPFVLSSTRAHDPLGLIDKWLAKNGHTTLTYGKEDADYTLFKVSPDFVVYHWAGHLRHADAHKVDAAYVTFCFDHCAQDQLANASIIMIKKKRADAEVLAAFSSLPSWSLSRPQGERPRAMQR